MPRPRTPSASARSARWIDAEDVRLGAWLIVLVTVAASCYVALTWDRPHRSAMLSVLLGASALVAGARWIVRPVLRRARGAGEGHLVWALASVGVVVVLTAIDGGASSPLRAFLFVAVAFAALAYSLRPAIAVALTSLAAGAVLSVVGGGLRDGDAEIVAVALALTAWLGIHQAGRETARRVELTAQRDSLRESERRFRDGFMLSPVGMALIDDQGRYVQVNDALCRLVGRSREWLTGRSYTSIAHPDSLRADARRVAEWRRIRLIRGDVERVTHERRYLHADGRTIVMLVGVSVIRDADGRFRHFHAQLVDITDERRAAERAQRRARQQAAVAAVGQRALEAAPLAELHQEIVDAIAETLAVEACAVVELRDADDTATICAARGISIDHLPAPRPERDTMLGRTLATRAPVIMDDARTDRRFHASLAYEHGLLSGLSVPVMGREDGPFGVLVAHAAAPCFFEADDVSFLQALANVLGGALDREAAETRLRHLSSHDALTGLPNRTLMLDRLGHALGRAQRSGETIAVTFLDVDHFKTINDAYGHSAGDELLRALTPRLRRMLRAGDTLARFGGDEFVVLSEGMRNAASAYALAERLLAVFDAPVVIEQEDGHPTEHHVSASIGVAVATGEHANDPDALIRDADIAMYRAKQMRGRIEVFDRTSRTRVVERVRMTSALRRALDDDELFLVYQPIVDLRDGSITQVESLLRWQHPTRGLVSPAEFIPLAEESGLVLPIGAWVVERLAAQMAAWDRGTVPMLRGLHVGTNISTRQLVEPGLAGMVGGALTRHGIAPERVTCEITETALIDDPVRAADNVAALVGAGMRVSLDDFCTGYSSLEHLKRFPLSAIKLDRTFVADVATNPIDLAIVRGLVEIAGAMRIVTVAEGLETFEQLARLRAVGCDLAQGFLFAPPLEALALAAHLASLPAGRCDLERIGLDTAIRA